MSQVGSCHRSAGFEMSGSDPRLNPQGHEAVLPPTMLTVGEPWDKSSRRWPPGWLMRRCRSYLSLLTHHTGTCIYSPIPHDDELATIATFVRRVGLLPTDPEDT